MIRPRIRLVALLAIVFLCSVRTSPANPLSGYRWKNRVIVLSIDPAQARGGGATLKGNKAGLLDRDLVVINVSAHPKDISQTVRPSAEAIRDLRRRLAIRETGNTFVLIGKDGGVKARQTDSLNLGRFFSLIDAMPMRREEMRGQRP